MLHSLLDLSNYCSNLALDCSASWCSYSWHLLKSHLHQRNFFHFLQIKALIDSKEIHLDDIPIILFSSVFDGVLQEFFNRFQDFERISDRTRLVAYPHVVETETAPLNLPMELVELKNDEQFVKKI